MASLTLVFILVVCLAVFHRGIDSEATRAAAVPVQETCTVSTVTEGEPAVMTFKLRSGIDTTSKKFFAHLRRNDRKLTDIMTCDGLNIACDVKDDHPMFQVDDNNIKENVLTVRISNMSRELEDTYVLQVYFNGTPEPPNSCTLNTTYTHTTPMAGDEDGSNDWIAAPIICLLLLLIIGILLLIYRKKNEDRNPHVHKADNADGAEGDRMLEAHTNAHTQSTRNHDKPDTPRPEDQGQQTSVRENTPQHVPPPELGQTSPPSDKTPIEREQIISHEGMRWFVGNRSDDEVDNLFECVKPRAGHFLITQSKADLSSFTLFVCWKGWKDQPKVDRFYITHNDSGFTVNIIPNTHFDTLCELVNVYKTNPMRVGGKVLGTLSKPCEEEPKDAWYFGSLSGDKVEKLLFTMHTEEGSFVVTKSSTNEDNYTLSVKFGGKLVPYTIVPREDGFKIAHLTGSFMTLKKLVEHYKKHDLDGRGKLKKSLELIPEELTTKEKQILEKNGPGSFFFKDSSVPGRRILAVNANSKMRQLVIIKSNDSCRIADHGIHHNDEGALENYYKGMVITIHGEEYCKLKTNCTHKLDKK